MSDILFSLAILACLIYVFYPEKDPRRCTIDARDLQKGDLFTYTTEGGETTTEDEVLHVEPSDTTLGFVFVIGKLDTHHLDEEKYVSIRVRK
jgi:hypothetical protein